MNNSIAEIYLKAVEANLICKKAAKKKIMENISSDIFDFCERYSDDLTLDVLVNRFGKPEDLASSFLKDMDGAELKTRLSNRKYIIIAIVVGTLIGIAAIIVGAKCYKRWEFFSHPDGYEVQWPIYVLETEEEVEEFKEMIGEE